MPSAAFQQDDEITGSAFDARLAKRLVAYARPYGLLAAGSLSILLVDGLLQLAGPLLTRHVIDVAVPAADGAMVVRDALLFVGVLAAQFVAGYGETVLTAVIGQRVMRDMREQFFAHVQRLSIPFFDRNPVGRLVTRLTQDIESLNELFTAGVVAGFGDLFTLAAIGVLMLVDRLAARARGLWRGAVHRRRVARVPAARARGVSRHPRRSSRGSTRSCRSASPACAWCRCSGAKRMSGRASRR